LSPYCRGHLDCRSIYTRGMAGHVASEAVFRGVGGMSRWWLKYFAELRVIGLDTFHEAVMDRDRRVPLLTVSNHLSTVDDPVMWGGLLTDAQIAELVRCGRMRHVGGAEELLYTNPLFSWFFRTGQAIPIVRGRGVYQKAMGSALGILDSGGWLHFFPEGKVVPGAERADYRIERLKWGIGRLLMDCKRAPIVLPVLLKGFDVMKPPERLPRPAQPVQIAIGRPLLASELLRLTEHIGCIETRRSVITEKIQQHMNKTLQLLE
jgi:monolysocardiolipin acyltransferase